MIWNVGLHGLVNVSHRQRTRVKNSTERCSQFQKLKPQSTDQRIQPNGNHAKTIEYQSKNIGAQNATETADAGRSSDRLDVIITARQWAVGAQFLAGL